MSRATLTVATIRPLRLAGRGFVPGEHVRVTVTPPNAAPERGHARADAEGAFTVAFPDVDPAQGLEGVAAGDAGSHASFQFSTAG